ncbi:MAG: T9SS type A sorting domain-containing protein [Bacteroidales bacterium]|nr:T9SS type A sorting domain-containing protein [Bacteroidales bacterium]
MKKVTCLLAALLLACGLSWAQTTDVLNHDVIGVNGTSYSTWTGITSNSDAVYAGNTAGGNNAIQMRSNNNNSGIITTASGGVVTNITVVWNENTTAGRTLNVYGKNAAYSAASDLYGNNAGTLIGTIVCNEGESTELDIDDEYAFIGIRSNSGALYLDEVSITWGEGSGVTPPSIEASNVEIAYDATEGAIAYTINNPVDGGELTAATEAEWLTVGTVGETVPFTCTVNEDGAAREAVVTLTYTYGEQAINQAVTVTQAGNPNTLDNISDITAAGTYAVQGTIVAKSTRGFIVGDGTGYVYYYNTNYEQDAYAIGDMVKLAGNVVVYGGVFEFNNSTTVTAATSSNYVEEEPTVLTGADMDARVASTTPAQLSNYVQYEGTLSVSSTHYNINDIEGATTAIGSISYPLNADFATLNGKQVKVTGYYVGISTSTYYNTMIGSVEEIASTEPIITLSPASVDVEATEAEGALTMTYLNMGDEPLFEVAYFEADGQTEATYDWIIAEVEGDQVNYIIGANQGEARTAYLKVYGTDGNIDVYSNLVTINQEAYVAPALDYAELPFEFNGGRDDVEGTNGLTAEGLGTDYNATYNPTTKLKFDGTGDWMILHFNEAPGTLTFDIKGNGFSGGTFTVQTSEDGETYEDLAAYTELGDVETMTFADLGENVRYIKWVYTEKVSGNVGLGNIHLYEMGGGPVLPASITVAPATVNATYEETEGTLTVTYENISDVVAEVNFCDAEGEAATYDWILAYIDDENNVYYVIDANEGEARTAYLKVSALDDNTEIVYSNLVTINQAAPVVPPTPGEWVMVSLNDLTEDDVFVIVGVYDEDESSFAMPNNGTGAPSATAVTLVGNTLSGDIDDNLKWNLSIGENGYTFYPNGETETWLYCTNSNNGVRVGTNENNVFTMTPEGYLFNNATERYIGIYNRQDWRCYTSIINNIKDQTFAFYKRVDEGSLVTYTLDIEGYGDSDGGYYLIASPVSMIRPTAENGFLTEAYDLYYFDQAKQGEEWRNYKAKHFNIASGKGYLYASQENTTLTFTGIPYNGDGKFALDYTEDVDFTGWNLIGNPYDADYNIYIGNGSVYSVTDFYVLNQSGDDFELAGRSAVHPKEGILVGATAADQFAYFSNDSGAIGGDPITRLNIRVSDENGKSDFARIRFGEGSNLEKFMLNPENTKIYFTMDNEEYAVVYTESIGEMPLYFKAAANGTYTFTVNADDMEMDYLHLIDNLTGNDIDLLAVSSYSFEAKKSDYANRFKLVYAQFDNIDETSSDAFAFFNNGSFIIANEGNATLQVVDMTGRIVQSETINGTASVSVDTTPGVYMLRLINGDNEKVQKVIVK